MLAYARKACSVSLTRRRPNGVRRGFATASESSTAQKTSKLHQGVQRDLKRGNMWEYAQMKKHPDGKIWASKEVLAEQNIMWPSELNTVRGKGLLKRGEVDLKTLFSENYATFCVVTQKRPFAVNQIESWTLPIRERHPSTPIADLTISQNYGYWWLSPILAQIASAQDRVNSVFGFSFVSGLRNLTKDDFGIDIENGFLSYQFVVDSDSKIRWVSVGSCVDKDLDRVSSVIKRLKAEYNTKPYVTKPTKVVEAAQGDVQKKL